MDNNSCKDIYISIVLKRLDLDIEGIEVMSNFKVKFLPDEKEVEVAGGTTLLEAAGWSFSLRPG
jgi:hypothetical protein